MNWKEGTFKGKKVWIEVSAEGQPLLQNGRVGMRYFNSPNAKTYRAFAGNIQLGDGPVTSISASTSTKKQASSSRASGFGSAKNRSQAQKDSAKQSAKELVAGFSKDMVICFTDGACRGNPGPSGAGVVLKTPDGKIYTRGKYLGQGTNNIAELTALDIALDMVAEQGFETEAPVALLTDSKYSQGVLTLGWKAKANRELIFKIRDRIRKRGNIRLYWVAGHAGIDENELADQLATEAIQNRS